MEISPLREEQGSGGFPTVQNLRYYMRKKDMLSHILDKRSGGRGRSLVHTMGYDQDVDISSQD